MRIAFDELVPEGEEVTRIRVAWNETEAASIGACLTAAGIEYAQERSTGDEGWAIYTAASDVDAALHALRLAGLSGVEEEYFAGL
ncbi:MAG TPA: hypothetical protein VFP50_03210 [Anaeromyxobacteraceae bacterium]|nr:hypothetical protein [Anaeromyxobacteraceae bacterium]